MNINIALLNFSLIPSEQEMVVKATVSDSWV